MKNLQLLSGIIIGVGFCLLISANSKNTLNEDVPRYHLTTTAATTGFAYDAVTGEMKLISYKDAQKAQNIKTLLGK